MYKLYAMLIIYGDMLLAVQ